MRTWQLHPRLAPLLGAALVASASVLLLPRYACAQGQVSFSRDVKPILARRCFACHGNDAAEAGLRLHEQDPSRAALDSGTHAIVPRDPATSELLARVTADDEALRMPPEGKPLTKSEVAILRAWIEAGANYEQHWSFVPMSKPVVPEVDAAWQRNPVDAFVLDKLNAAGLTPAPEADRRTLARRLYYNFTGLPPTAEELQAFVDDPAPDAYERLVDRLLASPHYGEHWARHWLDVVRYGESNSFERDNPKPNVWKYRDWVVRSLNNDKPYDQFVREQLAGDELDNVTADTMTATGYYRLGVWQDEPADEEQTLADEMDDLISTTGQAFLGLTVGCARCHDHKIDPIPQSDYYSLVAFFADVTSYGNRYDQESNNQYLVGDPAVEQQRAELLDRQRELEDEKHRVEQAAIVRMPGALQRQTEESRRKAVLRKHLDEYLTVDERMQYRELNSQLAAIGREIRDLPPPEAVLALARVHSPPPAVHIHMRGNPHVLGDEVQPRFPELFGDESPPAASPEGESRSAGRRRVFAEWLTRDDNPLTARVIVNRVWQHHWGRGIVRSANNFGQLGTPPTHPELLDWLAQYLIDHDWQLKPLHRLIATSATYRMASTATPEALASDPLNDLMWRYDPRRLTAEEVRDSILAVSGNLNRQVHGPSMYPRLSDEVLATQSVPGRGWGHSSDGERWRRSLYIHAKRSLMEPLLAAFDAPDPDTSCEARFNTTQPAQAFALLHGEFIHEQAEILSRRVEQAAGDDPRQQVAKAVELVLNRPATDADISDGLALIDKLQQTRGKPPHEALRLYCLATFNFNEFLYID